MTACAATKPRVQLGPSELAHAEAKPSGLAQLRVYPSTSLVLLYTSSAAPSGAMRSRQPQTLELSISAKTPGQIIFEDLHHGQRRFWVTFDPRCRRHRCAFGFVFTERKRFELSDLPARSGFLPPALYHQRVERSHQMQKGRFARLVEANDVWIYRGPKGRRTVSLQTERGEKVRRRRSERSQGIQ